MKPITVTLDGAMAMTSLSRSTLYKLFREHKLTPRKAGGRTLILVAELEEMINALPVGVED